MGLLPMNASTELVPKINITAMIGEAISTERPMSRVSDGSCAEHSTERYHRDREQQEIPCDHKSGELVEAQFSPLINTAFERYPVAEIHNDHRLGNVKKQDRQQPEEELRLAEFCSGADPTRADHKQNLCQHKVAQSQRLFQRDAVLCNVVFCAIELGCHTQRVKN